MLTANEIRESFVKFFESKGHHIVPSAPMVIKDDPTLMFTNAGMNQFKDIILGNRKPKYRRVTDSQKCLRVSGKHNDLEEVGHDTYHHTMFEMLGNWSFGDYFKKEAISWAWEYLVDVLKISPDRLYATVFEGSPAEGLDRDNEAASYWEQFLPAERIVNGNRHDNFWEMGDTGPCGPCSEIHIDLRSDEERKKVDGLSLVNKSHPQVIEIWNLVFMQYNRKADGSLEPLPERVIDTGMGFERLCMALQGKTSNYDTDVFQPLIKAISDISGIKYGEAPQTDVAMRVVADHVRTIAFSITDGQLPSNAKAGYVIRRILRRAVRYGYTFLGQKSAFMYKLLPVLIAEMGTAYPELESQKILISKVIKEEEEAFLRTLDTGIRLLDKVMADAKSAGRTVIGGKDAFTLYDTYGFPLDLTELILKENGLGVDVKEFDTEMSKQKERARNAAAKEMGDWIVLREGTTEFVGYDHLEYDCRILRYREVKQKDKTCFQVVLDKTPFYAEMGGQVGDTGVLTDGDETVEITDTKRENNLPVHIVNAMPLHPESVFKASVNRERRLASAANHSATHLLHEALREVLGPHVEQKGSLVTPEVLRFDFSHFQKMTHDEIRRVERLVNANIRKNIALKEYRSIPMDEARKMGAMALFGEKYGEEVRVICFDKSIELCGGVHIQATGQIGMFKIVSEGSVAAGVRRIEAATGRQAEDIVDSMENTLRVARALFNNVPDLAGSIRKLIEENDHYKKEMENVAKEKAVVMKKELEAKAELVNGIKIVKVNMPVDPVLLKNAAFMLQKETENTAVLGAFEYAGKPQLMIMYSSDLVAAGHNAGKDIKEAAKAIAGGGGGQPGLATAGGKDTGGLSDALDIMLKLATDNK